jgi:hypothetical protein
MTRCFPTKYTQKYVHTYHSRFPEWVAETTQILLQENGLAIRITVHLMFFRISEMPLLPLRG